MVSVLIAARNEEADILLCLDAIYRQEWPIEAFEVWIGDDRSEDQTATIVEEYIQDKPNFRLISITQSVGMARGKANVLAQLVQQAKGNFMLITDADIQVPPTWIKTMLSACTPGVGIVTGVTVVQGGQLLYLMQALEWVYSIGMMKWFADRNIPVTTMGNNMLIIREAYVATGGYENLPFSVTEDYQLFREVLKRGYGFRQLFEPGVLAYSQPASSLRQLLDQRKRWMVGALQLPIGLRILLILGALFFPVNIVLAFFFPWWAILLFTVQSSSILFSLLVSLQRLRLFSLQRYTWLYPFYHYLILLANLVYYFLPGPIQWKGRSYSRK